MSLGFSGFFSSFESPVNNSDIVSCLGTVNYLPGSTSPTGVVRWQTWGQNIILYSEGYITTSAGGGAIVGIGIGLLDGGTYVGFANNLSSNIPVAVVNVAYTQGNLQLLLQSGTQSANVSFFVMGPRPPNL